MTNNIVKACCYNCGYPSLQFHKPQHISNNNSINHMFDSSIRYFCNNCNTIAGCNYEEYDEYDAYIEYRG